MKRPAFQFYPADWQKDAALQSCSIGARGLWIEMLCIMHQCEPYGHMAVNGKPMTNEQLARLVGETPAFVRKALVELEDAAVFSRDSAGCIYSRRMVNDERLRNVRAEAGKLGGNPKLLEGKDKQKDKQTDNHASKQSPTPSSSSSSSSSGGKAEVAASDNASTGLDAASATLRGELSKALRERGVGITSGDPLLTEWVELGATVQHGIEAVERARLHKPAPAPIPSKYLDPIIRDVLSPRPSAGTRINGHTSHAIDWWSSPDGIYAKAQAEGVEIAMRDTGDGEVRDSRETLARLCVKLGDGSWVDTRNATLVRRIEELRSDANREGQTA